MIRYVTSNPGKAREAEAYFDEPVEQVAYDYTEIQSDSLADVAAHGAREAHEAVGDPVVVDDAGLFVDAFDGFPGPYSAYVEDTVGVEGVWRLTEAETEEEARRASFRIALAYCDEDTLAERPEGVAVFEARVTGRLVAPRGEGGFGYDPIFEYNGRTLAEMSPEEKNAISHRGRALGTFVEWYADDRGGE